VTPVFHNSQNHFHHHQQVLKASFEPQEEEDKQGGNDDEILRRQQCDQRYMLEPLYKPQIKKSCNNEMLNNESKESVFSHDDSAWPVDNPVGMGSVVMGSMVMGSIRN